VPELPDVETFKRDLDAAALHRRIERVEILAPRLLAGISPRALCRALMRRRFEASRRHGKYLFVRLDDNRWLVLHFGMSGRTAVFRHASDRPRYAQLVLRFADGLRLAYVAPRKLGRIALVDDPSAFVQPRGLGVDAMAVEWPAFHAFAAGRRDAVKGWLLDQSAIAGIGNIYGDEILFQARIDPRRKVSGLGVAELRRLYREMRRVLERAIDARAEPARMPRRWLLPHRHRGACCPRCAAAGDPRLRPDKLRLRPLPAVALNRRCA